MGHFFPVSLVGHLALPGSEPILGLSNGPPGVRVHHLVRMGSGEEWVGQAGITYCR